MSYFLVCSLVLQRSSATKLLDMEKLTTKMYGFASVKTSAITQSMVSNGQENQVGLSSPLVQWDEGTK